MKHQSLYPPFKSSQLKTLEWGISGLRLNPLFFLICRLNIACSLLIFNLQINYPIRIKDTPFISSHLRLINRSGLRISHSKVFSSVRLNVESCSRQHPECANSYHENTPNRIFNRFLKSILLKIRCSLNPKSQAVNKFQRQLRPEPYFHDLLKSRAQSTIKCNSSLIQDLDQASISTIQEFPVSRKSF